eukprot:gene14381-15879_t
MQRQYGSMSMPTPVIPTHIASSYGNTGYSPLPPINTVENEIDREMSKLIDNLKMSINHATTKDLEGLSNNEDSINMLIEDSEQPELESFKEKLSEAILMQSSKKEEYDILKSKLESLAGSFSLDTTLALLQAEASEKDSQTEKISDKLIDDDMQLDEFLQTYLSERTKYHLLRIKADKLAEIVRGGVQTAPGNSYYATSYGRF